MLVLLVSLTLGMLTGIVTGLLPGLHPNSVIFLLLPVYFRTDVAPLTFVAFATGVSGVHTFVSFIPSVYVGVPEGDTALAALPGHRLVRQGRGYEAIELTAVGGLMATATAVAALPVLWVTIPVVYSGLAAIMHLLLGAVIVYLLWRAQDSVATGAVMLLAATLGVVALSSSLANTQYILFAIFAGMFGLSMIVSTLVEDADVPPQGRSLPVGLEDAVGGGVRGFVAGLIAGFMPGLGSAQSALLVSRADDTEGFMVTMGGITTTDIFFSLVALYVIGKPRSGAAVAMQQVVTGIDRTTVVLVVGMCLVSVGVGALLTRGLGSRAATVFPRIDYRSLLLTVAALVVAGSVVLNGLFGLLVLATATAIGMLSIRTGVRRSTAMTVLMVPTILYYAGVHVPLL